MSEMMQLAFLVCTSASALVASIRRCLKDTSPRHFHKIFTSWGLPEDFDDAEKLSRMAVLLDFWNDFLRISWFVLWIAHRLDREPWYWSGEWRLPSWEGLVVVSLEMVAMSLLIVVLIPQVVSTFRGTRIAVATMPLLFRLEGLVSPLTRSFRALQKALLRFVGGGKEPTGAALAEEGIRSAVAIGEWEGVLHDQEKSMIESMLEFSDVEVTEVMTPRTEMVCMEATLTVEGAIPQVIDCGHSRIPLYRENIDNIVGILYVKDLLRYVGNEAKRRATLEELGRRVYFVPQTKKVSELLTEFRVNRFHIAMILDEYGGTSGLITIEDIIEEIVGEIEDEYDQGTLSTIRKIDAVTWDLDGRAHISEINEKLGLSLPESGDYDTIAGFLFVLLGKVPEQGEIVEWENLQFRITAADERKIKQLRVHVLHPESQRAEP